MDKDVKQNFSKNEERERKAGKIFHNLYGVKRFDVQGKKILEHGKRISKSYSIDETEREREKEKILQGCNINMQGTGATIFEDLGDEAST